MSAFRVTPEAVLEVAGRLGAISGGVDELHSRLSPHAAAGTGTPADGAIAALAGHWAQVLPVFSLAGDHLSRAVGGAASAYRGSDTAIGDACGGGGGGGGGSGAHR
jgi:hypothetical protein